MQKLTAPPSMKEGLVRSWLQRMRKGYNSITDKFQPIEDDITSIGTDITSIGTDITSLGADITSLDTAITSVAGDIGVYACNQYSNIGSGYTSVGAGSTWSYVQDADSWSGYYWYNDSASDGDCIYYDIYLGAGTYKVSIIYQENQYLGIFSGTINSVEVIRKDMYVISANANKFKWGQGTAFYLTEAQKITLKITCDGKNAGSSGYMIPWNFLFINAF